MQQFSYYLRIDSDAWFTKDVPCSINPFNLYGNRAAQQNKGESSQPLFFVYPARKPIALSACSEGLFDFIDTYRQTQGTSQCSQGKKKIVHQVSIISMNIFACMLVSHAWETIFEANNPPRAPKLNLVGLVLRHIDTREKVGPGSRRRNLPRIPGLWQPFLFPIGAVQKSGQGNSRRRSSFREQMGTMQTVEEFVVILSAYLIDVRS